MREESRFASLPNNRCTHRISYNANDVMKKWLFIVEYWPVLLDNKLKSQLITHTNKKLTKN